MCQFTSSGKGDSDVPYLLLIDDSKGSSNIYEPFIPSSPKCYSMIQTEKVDRAIFVPFAIKEAIAIANIAVPMVLTGLMLYSRSLISMLFLGRLGDLALAGGSLAIGFANITGYSILSGLAMGMESICGQAFGAKRYTVLGITLQRTDETIATEAQWYLVYSLPDLLAQSVLHPLRIYLRTQSITLPLTCCAMLSILLHIPINYLLVSYLKLGIKGVALSGERRFDGDFDPNDGVDLHIPSSLSFGVSTRVGNELGANQPKKAKLAAFVGLFCGFMLGLSALVFATMVRNIWASMFTGDKEIIALTSLVLPIIGLCELGNCPQTTGCGVLRGTARPKDGANINLGCFYLVGMPVAVWLAFFAGYDFKGLWLGMLAAQVSCMVTMLLVLIRTDWDFEAERAKKLTGAQLVVDDSKEKPNQAEIKEDSFSLLGDLDHYCLV
ncbi:traB domain-containing protein-like isoform X1 [Hibiscus syriacus]|uniref:TraB domain-containing protein-like isoform X1 n=1 Tax=Hibiscus syriacus TaxID=106335 RepID=A0A6A2XU39_HIBSY|nr:traB domain-containing protein-like isoform X1 [Hibiscus syriacus]